MPAPLEVTLGHDGRHWFVSDHDRDIRASSVTELEHRLLAHLDASGSGSLDIHLRCDRNLLPVWMRQYAAHYFNRIIQYRPPVTGHG